MQNILDLVKSGTGLLAAQILRLESQINKLVSFSLPQAEKDFFEQDITEREEYDRALHEFKVAGEVQNTTDLLGLSEEGCISYFKVWFGFFFAD